MLVSISTLLCNYSNQPVFYLRKQTLLGGALKQSCLLTATLPKVGHWTPAIGSTSHHVCVFH